MSPTQLQVTLTASAGAAQGSAVLAAEVIGPAVGDVRRMPLQTGATTTVDVLPGSYLVRIAAPDGALTDAMVHVADGESGTVTLNVPRWTVPSTDPPIPPPTGAPGEPYAWVELWSGPESVGWTGATADGTSSGRWRITYDGMSRLHQVQVGAPDSSWRTISLPPAESTGLAITPVAANGDFDDGLRVEVSSEDARARAMLDYLAAGQVGQAQVVAIDVVEMAVRAFQEKLVHPEGAAVAGYLLLRLRESDRLRDWGQNFANWFEWLPDAQVIHAWQLLNRPGAPDRDIARMRLLKAVESGVPCYTEGLRLLFDGLRGLSGADQSDPEVEQALDRVRGYANACDWSATMTTYWSQSPAEPSLERRTGWPDDRPNVVRLAMVG